VQQRLARAGVAHVERVAGLHHRAGAEVLLDQHRDHLGAHLGGNVARLERAEERVHQHAVAHLDRHLCEVLVRTVHRVAGLERGHARPAELLELRARLGRRHEERPVLRLEAAVGEHLHRPGEVVLVLRHHHRNPGMRGIGGAEHRLAFLRLVDLVALGDAHRGQRFAAFRVHQGNVFFYLFLRRKRDGDRPEQARGEAVFPAHAFPVGARHEALERREAADAEHDEIAALARGDAKLGQGAGARLLRGERLALQRTRF
jgi:hypothetical protein